MILKTTFLLLIIWNSFIKLNCMKLKSLISRKKSPHQLLVEALHTIARDNEILSVENNLASASFFWYPFLPGKIDKQQNNCCCVLPYQLDCGYGILYITDLFSELSKYCLQNPMESIPLENIEFGGGASPTAKLPIHSEGESEKKSEPKSKELKVVTLLNAKKTLETFLRSNYDCINEQWTVYFSHESIPTPPEILQTLANLIVNVVIFFKSPFSDRPRVLQCKLCPESPVFSEMLHYVVLLLATNQEGITLDWKPRDFKPLDRFSEVNNDPTFENRVSTINNAKALKEMVTKGLLVTKRKEELLRQTNVCYISFRTKAKQAAAKSYSKARFLFCRIDSQGKMSAFKEADFKITGELPQSLIDAPYIRHMVFLSRLRTAKKGEQRGLHVELKYNVGDSEPVALRV